MLSRISVRRALHVLLSSVVLLAFAAGVSAQTLTDDQPAATEGQPQESGAPAAGDDAAPDNEQEIPDEDSDASVTETEDQASKDQASEKTESVKARFQAYVPSVQRMLEKLRQSLAGRIATEINSAMEASRELDEDDADPQRLRDVLAVLKSWPDAELSLAIFTPDATGKLRWAVQIGLPVGQVHDLIANLKTDETTGDFFQGLNESVTDGEFVYRVGSHTVARLKAIDAGNCLLRSHGAVSLPAKFFKGTKGDEELVMATRLVLKKTEKDSDSSFLSNFSLVTAIDYTARIDADGLWHDQLRVAWPIVSGLTLKAMIGSPKQSFYVPGDAFMGAVFNIGSTKQILQSSAGMESPQGPISRYAGDEMLVTVLPGDGFLPVPEIVAQCRTTKPDKLLDALSREIGSLNKKAEQKEREPEWHETSVDDHRVFWCEKRGKSGPSLVPFKMRPVLFVQRAKDARKRDRDFLIAGWTSTNPERFVKRWLERPRNTDNVQFLPVDRDNNAEAWIHWQQIYDWAQPYVNLGIRSVASGPLLTEDLAADVPDASLAGELKLGGMILNHRGPVPLGLVAVPALAAAGTSETSNTDMARERTARRQLEVLYHHCKLFHKDTGRWPVRVAELDGYIDFTGHRELLKLRESSRERFGKLLGSLFGGKKKKDKNDEGDPETEDEELYGDIDDSIYVVGWDNDEWRLGFAEDQLEHLQQLYINANGTIHRVEKALSSEKQHKSASGAANDKQDAADQAVANT